MQTSMKNLSNRWRKCTRALKLEDQKYGLRLAEALERRNPQEYAMFDDPLEAAMLFLLIDIMREREKAETVHPCGNSVTLSSSTG